MIIDDNDNSFPIAIRNRYEILRRMFVLEGRAIIDPSSLLAASRVLIRIETDIGQTPGTLLHSHLMRLKTLRLGRFLKKT